MEQKKILVLEDNYALRRLYVRNLSNGGFEVEEAGDLREGQTKLAENHYHAVLLDVELSDGNSFQLMDQLKQDGTIVIAMSSDHRHSDMCREHGTDFFFAKPIPSRTLADYIWDILTNPHEFGYAPAWEDTNVTVTPRR